jgi:hypothetical protein
MIRYLFIPFFLLLVTPSIFAKGKNEPVLNPQSYKHYIDSFIINDNELYKGAISNSECWQFLSGNIPLLDCPDKAIEKTYYFRWWTYRKHIKKTPEGFVITEFLPDVPWAGKYNTISCAAAFHFYEGRWIRDQKYLNDYAVFWFRKGGSPRSYSFWAADALYKYFLVSGNSSLIKDLLPDLINNYESWEKEKLSPSGLFWQVDDRDGMEISVCGSGYRATINSYMFGDALAVAAIASLSGDKDFTNLYSEKAKRIKQAVESRLWDKQAEFFKVLPRDSSAQLCTSKELHGYTPWYFNLPDPEFSSAWKYLMDSTCFFAPYGLTTVEKQSPGFQISYQGHECQWNGPSWPYATSITLTALANLLNEYSQQFISKEDFFHLLQIYTKSHQLKLDDGKIVPWIDENLNPFTGDWISRTRLKNWDNGSWSKGKGGIERGKDYNHSTYCDLIISGLLGIRPQESNLLIINPLIPDNVWNYYCLDNLVYHGHEITVYYDKTGKRYKKGKGFFVFVDGKQVAHTTSLQKVIIEL